MVSRAGQRRGGPTPNSVVSVADLLARDAPWSGAPSAVPVAKRTVAAIPAQRSGPPSQARTGSRGGAPTATRARAISPAGARAGSRPVAARIDGSRLREFASVALGPRWRFVTIAAAVLLAGLMANGVMLATFSGSSHSTTAQSDEGGYPDPDPNAASRSYDDNGMPFDSALTPMFVAPGAGNLAAANTSGVGVPMSLASLRTSAPASSSAATTVLRGTPAVSAPVRAVSPSTGSTGTGSVGTSTKSSSGSVVGDVVRDTTSGLGNTVEDTASGLGKTVDKTASGLGKTLKKTTSGLGDTLGNVTDDLLGGGSKSKSSGSSDGSFSGGSSKSSSNGGLLGGLLGK